MICGVTDDAKQYLLNSLHVQEDDANALASKKQNTLMSTSSDSDNNGAMATYCANTHNTTC